jgi:gluconolactonase
MTSDGVLKCLLHTVPSPNGVTLDLDESSLFVAATRSNNIWRVPNVRDGDAAKVGVFIQLSGGPGGPDGMALDEKGNLAVAHFGLGCVWLFDPHGQPLYRVQSCRGRLTTNVAYEGVDGRTMFITEAESGAILCARMPVAGKAMFSHQS